MTRGLREILPALALLIWIHGLYFTLNLLISQAGSRTLADPALVALTWAYSFGVVGAIFWLLARIGRLIEAFLVSLSTRADTSWDDLLLPLAGKAVRRALPLLALILGAPAFSVSPGAGRDGPECHEPPADRGRRVHPVPDRGRRGIVRPQ